MPLCREPEDGNSEWARYFPDGVVKFLTRQNGDTSLKSILQRFEGAASKCSDESGSAISVASSRPHFRYTEY